MVIDRLGENKITPSESGVEIVTEKFSFMHRVNDWTGVMNDSAIDDLWVPILFMWLNNFFELEWKVLIR